MGLHEWRTQEKESIPEAVGASGSPTGGDAVEVGARGAPGSKLRKHLLLVHLILSS